MLVKPEQLTSPYASIMNVGPIGAGKTQSLASLYWHNLAAHPNGPRQLWHYDLDGTGAVSLVRIAQHGSSPNNKPQIKGGWLNDLKVYRYRLRGEKAQIKPTSAGDISKARTSDLLDKFVAEFNEMIQMVDGKTGTWRDPENSPGIICIDSATSLENWITDATCSIRGRDINSPLATERARYADWGAIKDKELEIVQCAKALPCYFVYNVHDELRVFTIPEPISMTLNSTGEVQQSGGQRSMGDVYIYPALTGSLRDDLGGEFDVVMYSRAEGKKYYWVTRPRQEGQATLRAAKTRTRDDLDVVMEQDYRELLK